MAKFKEQLMWDRLKEAAQGILQMDRVENQCRESMPDVNGINRNGVDFWLELKALHVWPKRATTCPLKGAFQKGQIAWGLARNSWGGQSFVLLRVGKDWLLMYPWREMEEATQAQLRACAIVTTDNPGGIAHYLGSLQHGD